MAVVEKFKTAFVVNNVCNHDLLGATMSRMLKFSIPQANINRCLKKTKLIQYEEVKYFLVTAVFRSLFHVQNITLS